MKNLKHIKSFNESSENLNIPGVSDSYSKEQFEHEYPTGTDDLNKLIETLEFAKKEHGKSEMEKVKNYIIGVVSNYH